ncbi:MAG: alkaline phosphatase D family protein [Gemmataceae bacterium]|nr:alkaline phosphatase D family protein [Gemmataceae bacterium]
MARKKSMVSRRGFLAGSLTSVALPLVCAEETLAAQQQPASRQATGVKVGEVTDTSAIVWMRLTAHAAHNAGGRAIQSMGVPLPVGVDIGELRGACPGALGMVRLRYGTAEDLSGATATDWIEVMARTDFSHQFCLQGLKPGTTYHYSAETAGPGGKPAHGTLRGRFETAPAADRYSDVTFTVLSCTGYRDLDHPDGYHLYPAMAALRPQFYVHTGDNVYYDSDDFPANTVALARHHWHRMHGQPRCVAFHLRTPGYWIKDDHDTLANDCWPGQNVKRMLPLTFADGLRLFREQVPMGERTYRTFRWGRGLQVWLVEGRDFRSPNTMQDGPMKTIWGAEQKRWLLEGLRASDAEFKVLISPTPLVGPDRPNKRDNHSNAAFRHEGDEIRSWLQKHLPRRFFVICGDRHWQYHSVHPETGVREFGTGAASDAHAGGTPGEDKRYHRFHRVRGGFLSVSFTRRGERSALVVRHHDVMGKVVHSHQVNG